MTDEPEIVKELKEAEKLGKLKTQSHESYEELQMPTESLDETSDESFYTLKDDLENSRKDIKLGRVKEKYQTIFENYAVAITLVNTEERIVSWNKYAEELFNMNEKELYMKPVSTLYPIEEWKKIRAENVRKKGIKYRMETKMIKKNQGTFDVELSLCVLKSAEGKTVGSIGIIRDISKLKKTERRLKESEERYRTIFENSAVGITLTDGNERIISWNKFTEDLLGMNKEDLYHKPVESLYPPEEWQKIRSENVRRKGMQHHLETKIVKKNNKTIDVNISLSVLKNHKDKIVGSIGVIEDITGSKELQRGLEKSEKKFQILYEKAPIPYHALSPNGIITSVNKKWCQILGYSKKEVIGKSIFDFIIEEERKSAKSSFEKKIQFKKSYTGGHERKYLTKNGKEKIFVIHDFLLSDKNKNVVSVQTTMEDITKRKKVEETLRENEGKLRAIFDSVLDSIFIKDAHLRYVQVNRGMENLFGLKNSEIIGMTDDDLFGKDVAVHIKEDDLRVLRGETIRKEDTRSIRGSLFTFHIIETPVYEKDGKIIGVCGIAHDITKWKETKKVLQEREKRFRDIADNAREWIWEVDANGKYTYTSTIVEKILGYKPKEILGKHFYDLIHPEDREELKKAAFEVFAKKQPFQEFINRNVHKNGETVWLSTSGVPILDEDGNLLGYRGVDTDITERKQTEEEINNQVQALAEANVRGVKLLEELKASEGKLLKKVDELERFKKFSVDRELKMVELKERIKELEVQVMEKEK